MKEKDEKKASGSIRRTKLTLSVTAEDKKRLKIIAAKREKSISAMLREWIEKNAEEAEG
ncbi:ribbon-helix-helix protein, CopG family [Actinotignum urinale]|uniref:Ribbon-helix-helix protein, CopG family n=1 Tax=Actinotignum urinale TaxID=190146 RepID=A0ABU5G929_9ACTO|nr:ribbon-helix-helix protein, CopG family [Actinotignum urinale]MDY5133830.1 ribbon-helix-helix protein, CopG family [Actinotignum urinale]MDY5152051.1 ribbon-helix-helix protein, CopG family [Actinotignum urinale]